MLDLAIIGGGPAGLAAGLYATRGGLKNVVMFEKGMPGGQITSSSEMENYPGVPQVQDGISFMQPWSEQCTRFGLEIKMAGIQKVRKNGEIFEILLEDGTKESAKAVIVCTGSKPRRANFKGEDEFFGKGVSTCATCDGFFYKGKEVAVLGGGNTALEEALYLSEICSKVYLIYRRGEFSKAAPVVVEKVKNNPKIELILNSNIDKAYGDEKNGLTGLKIKSNSGEIRDLQVPGVFTFVGLDVQNSVLFDEQNNPICEILPSGQVKVNLKMQTSVAGLFAAGDLRQDAPKQVVCAAADGATAALGVIEYLR
nr:FAD-dependent oxidoreductase [Campylobacter sp.]